MKRKWALLTAALALPSCLVVGVPALAMVSIGCVIVGFIALIVIAHARAFKTHPWGLFAQYSEPRKLLFAKFNVREVDALHFSLALVAGGLLALLVLVKAGT